MNDATIMTPLLAAAGAWAAVVTIKITVLLLAVAGLALALRRSAAALRHLLWTAGIGCVLLLPLAARSLPGWRITLPQEIATLSGTRFADPAGMGGEAAPPAASGPVAAEEPAPGRAVAAVSRQGAPWLWLTWATGALLVAFRYGRGSLLVREQARGSRRLTEAEGCALGRAVAGEFGLREAVDLRVVDDDSSPRAAGFWRPVVLLPRQWLTWSEAQRRTVLLHELAHVRRGDCRSQTLATLACVLYWFHPLVWLAARRMVRERERACDDLVLAAGTKPSQYAQQLLDIAATLGRRGRPAFAEVPMARSSQLADRLLEILDPRSRPRPPRRRTGLLLVGALAAAAFAVAVLETGTATADRGVAAAPARTETVEEFAGAWRGLADEMLAAALDRDAKRFAACYSRQAHLMAQGVPTIRGRDAIADLVPRMWAVEAADVELKELEFFRVGDKYCVVGSLTFLAEGGSPLGTARFMSLYVYEDGRWRIHRDIANS